MACTGWLSPYKENEDFGADDFGKIGTKNRNLVDDSPWTPSENQVPTEITKVPEQERTTRPR